MLKQSKHHLIQLWKVNRNWKSVKVLETSMHIHMPFWEKPPSYTRWTLKSVILWMKSIIWHKRFSSPTPKIQHFTMFLEILLRESGAFLKKWILLNSSGMLTTSLKKLRRRKKNELYRYAELNKVKVRLFNRLVNNRLKNKINSLNNQILNTWKEPWFLFWMEPWDRLICSDPRIRSVLLLCTVSKTKRESKDDL